MKKLITAIFLLISGAAYSQYVPMMAKGYQFKYVKTDSGYVFPVRDTVTTVFKTFGSAVVRPQDSALYIFTNKWNKITAAGATTVSNKVDSVKILTDTLFYYINGVGYGSIFSVSSAYPTGLNFDTATGILTINRNGISDLTKGLDGRYDTTGHKHIAADITDFTAAGRALLTGAGNISYNSATGVITSTGIAGLTFPNTGNKYLNGYGAFANLNSDSLTEGAINLFYTAARANLKLNISDTAAMLTGYVRTQRFLDSLIAVRNKEVGDSNLLRGLINTNTSNIALKQNISDTSTVDATRYWVSQQGYLNTETDPTVSSIIKAIPVTTDATTDKYYYWNNGSIQRKKILYSELSGNPDLSGYELLANKSTTLTSPDNTKYPTTLAVSDALALKLNIIDTTNKWINNIRRSTDSVFYLKNGSWQFAFKDSVGSTQDLSGYINTVTGENYLSKTGNTLTANPVNVSGTNITGILKAASFPALTGDVSNTAGTLATTVVWANGYPTYDARYSLANNQWKITGNSGTVPATNFLGTTDSVDFIIKTKSTERIRVTGQGLTNIAAIPGSLGGGGIGIGITHDQINFPVGLNGYIRVGRGQTIVTRNTANTGDHILLSSNAGSFDDTQVGDGDYTLSLLGNEVYLPGVPGSSTPNEGQLKFTNRVGVHPMLAAQGALLRVLRVDGLGNGFAPISAQDITANGSLIVTGTARIDGNINFAGVTSAFPSLTRSGTTIKAMLADGSALTEINASHFSTYSPGSSTLTASGYYMANVANTRAWNTQPSENNDYTLFGYNGTAWKEKFRVLLNGNFGLNTPNPISLLHINFIDSFSRTNLTDILTLSGNSTVGTPYNGFGQAISWFGRTYLNSTERVLSRIYSQLNDNATDSLGTSLHFQTTTGSQTVVVPIDRMIIRNNGLIDVYNSIRGITEPLAENSLKLASTAWVKGQGYGIGNGSVTNVTGTNPITVTNGTTTPVISLDTTTSAGGWHSRDYNDLRYYPITANPRNYVQALVPTGGVGYLSKIGETLYSGLIVETDIQDLSITLPKMANITTNSLLGRSTAATGNVEVISVGSGLSLSGGILTATGGIDTTGFYLKNGALSSNRIVDVSGKNLWFKNAIGATTTVDKYFFGSHNTIQNKWATGTTSNSRQDLAVVNIVRDTTEPAYSQAMLTMSTNSTTRNGWVFSNQNEDDAKTYLPLLETFSNNRFTYGYRHIVFAPNVGDSITGWPVISYMIANYDSTDVNWLTRNVNVTRPLLEYVNGAHNINHRALKLLHNGTLQLGRYDTGYAQTTDVRIRLNTVGYSYLKDGLSIGSDTIPAGVIFDVNGMSRFNNLMSVVETVAANKSEIWSRGIRNTGASGNYGEVNQYGLSIYDGSLYTNNLKSNSLTADRIITLPNADGEAAVILKGSATLDFPSTAPNSTSTLTITIAGAADGDMIALGVPNASFIGTSHYNAFVSAANIVTVQFSNTSSSSLNPASGVFRVALIKN